MGNSLCEDFPFLSSAHGHGVNPTGPGMCDSGAEHVPGRCQGWAGPQHQTKALTPHRREQTLLKKCKSGWSRVATTLHAAIPDTILGIP